MAKTPEEIHFTDNSKLVEDISSLYLNEEFSDVTFTFDGQKLYAHKAILAARSHHFKTFFKDPEKTAQVEVPIIEFSVEAFRMFFKYIYSGGVTLDPSNMNVVTEVLILARQHSFSKFESSIMMKMEALLNLQNVPSVLNIANRFEFNELMEMCYTFLEEHASEFLGNDSFNKLSQTSLVRLLKRHTFYAPEIEIFKSVVKWSKINDDVDKLAIKSVRLSCLSVVEIVSIVRPSKLLEDKVLLDAITEIVEVEPKKMPCRWRLLIGENWATIAYKAEAVSGTNTDFLVNGTKDVKKFASHVIGDEEGIIIKLEVPAFVNHISMKFPDTDQRYYSYYIEVSTDKKNWKKIIDYSKYSCRSLQDLYFEQEIVRYIKIKGANSTVDNRLHLLFFQVDYKSTIPRMTNGIICPTANVATPEKNAIVIQGGFPDMLLNGNFKINPRDTKSYTYHTIGVDSIIIQLAQPYIISSMRMLLWDGDSRFYKYYIESSINKTDWEMVVDHRQDVCKSWQVINFSERPMVYIKITGTHNSANKWFYVIHFECPASP